MIQIIKFAYRDLGRNRRRTFFSALAVAMSLALMLLAASFVEGEMASSLENTIRLQSGHLQVRDADYDETKASLKWEDLVENPDTITAQLMALEPVKAATPRLYASGILAVGEESTGVAIVGIDPLSEANAPYRESMLSGQYLSADDREGILIGKALAEKLDLSAGDQVSLSVNTSDGDIAEQLFVIRGIYTTNTYAFDSATVFLPLSKAQAISKTENHASTVFVLLDQTDRTEAVASALQASSFNLLTWQDMNEIVIQTEAMAKTYMSFLYLIVLAIAATVIINTLIMAVFERTREIGILSAIGMKGRRILAMFMTESTLLALGGVAMGLVLGLLVVGFFNRNGFYVGNLGMTGFLIPDTIYARLNMQDVVNLSIATFIVAVISGLYPAVLAARLEPVQALRTEK